MTIKDVHEDTGFSLIFIREWIAQDPDHPFGVCVRMPGSKIRTFAIDADRYARWKKGQRRTTWQK